MGGGNHHSISVACRANLDELLIIAELKRTADNIIRQLRVCTSRVKSGRQGGGGGERRGSRSSTGNVLIKTCLGDLSTYPTYLLQSGLKYCVYTTQYYVNDSALHTDKTRGPITSDPDPSPMIGPAISPSFFPFGGFTQPCVASASASDALFFSGLT